MSSVPNLFSRCFERSSQQKYSVLQRNEAGMGIDEAEKWVRLSSIDAPTFEQFDCKKVESYINRIVAGLKKIPITSQNIAIIERHLVKIGSESSVVTQRLFEEILRLNIDKGHRERLGLCLAHIYTEKL